ncbi:Gfo/Idh/MocA family protein [Microterricola pindariensis]|uniref:Oxidoreductase n=1 Tax=Microterricola pindariensis TaxID=478010 RepID=A0ABX5AVW0_9MICO|nr:Gfo/Idh/MocA family oxidoreductase [Microterricola pindariensis]PPL18337.1 oxidoreductase [Microterricola pindariensis]
MSAPIRVAVVGTGSIAREHVAALASIPGVEVAYVCGSDLARAAAVASLAPGAEATTDLARVLADPSVLGVDVCNATPQHADSTISAGRAGKHVHVEKPAALTIADFDAMVAATEGSGTSLMVGQTVRFQPAVAALAERVHAGDIGTPRLAHVSWYTGYVWPGGWRGWQLDREKSGGHPVHNGTHSLDVAVWLMGRRPVRVFTRSFPSFAADMPVDDSFHMTVRFEDGSLATLEISYALAEPGDMFRRIMVAGTAGSIEHSTDSEPRLRAPGVRTAPASVEGAMRVQLAHWIELISGRAEPIVTTDQVRAALRTALAAQESLDTGRPVDIVWEDDK